MRVMKTDNAVDVWPDAALKNFIFYIFSIYEFSHSLGQTLPIHSAPVPTVVRYASDSDNFPRILARVMGAVVSSGVEDIRLTQNSVNIIQKLP
jgi:hypothetical protein